MNETKKGETMAFRDKWMGRLRLKTLPRSLARETCLQTEKDTVFNTRTFITFSALKTVICREVFFANEWKLREMQVAIAQGMIHQVCRRL